MSIQQDNIKKLVERRANAAMTLSTRKESSRHVRESLCFSTKEVSRNSTCSSSIAAQISEWKSSTSTVTA